MLNTWRLVPAPVTGRANLVCSHRPAPRLEPHTLQSSAIRPFCGCAHVAGYQLSGVVAVAAPELPFAFAGEGSGRAEASAQAVVLRSRQDPDLAKG